MIIDCYTKMALYLSIVKTIITIKLTNLFLTKYYTILKLLRELYLIIVVFSRINFSWAMLYYKNKT